MFNNTLTSDLVESQLSQDFSQLSWNSDMNSECKKQCEQESQLQQTKNVCRKRKRLPAHAEIKVLLEDNQALWTKLEVSESTNAVLTCKVAELSAQLKEAKKQKQPKASKKLRKKNKKLTRKVEKKQIKIREMKERLNAVEAEMQEMAKIMSMFEF